jgi:hypothetical protein
MKDVYNYIMVVSAITTGTVPIQSFAIGGGRDDFDGDSGWSGCLDACVSMPAGSTIQIKNPDMIGSKLFFRPFF